MNRWRCLSALRQRSLAGKRLKGCPPHSTNEGIRSLESFRANPAVDRIVRGVASDPAGREEIISSANEPLKLLVSTTHGYRGAAASGLVALWS